ncbi:MULTISPECIES: Single-stranded DNA binding protein [Halococcus]|uniref:Replication factor A n=1 Tax=Halococcus salifodinae DSM 8989 TaxID=1227456 RepID=M0N607_9EURY|nr:MULTISPECIES: Single-stranded DNA binding protein [Halococcus]EMA53367.1 replication factor A [Halococcus salifodinae DSM 8989]
MELDDHAEELASTLGVDKAEVRADLEKLVNYSVPIDEAKDSLRRKYGDGGGGGEPSALSIADVSTADSAVAVRGVVLTVGKRSIRYQGDDLVIREGEIADESGKISYTAWEEFDLSSGDTIEIVGAGVREWEGSPELNLGSETTVKIDDEPLDVSYDIGGDTHLSKLAPGDRGVALEVAVAEVERKTIDGRDGETEILSGVFADETGRLPFTDWDPHDEIEDGASVGIENAYVREFRGVPSVNVSEFSTVNALDRAVETGDGAPRMSVREAVVTEGLFDVEVTGNVLAVRDGSGLIQRCPECGRVVQKGQCRSHGDVDGEDDLRVKAIVDDGTDSLTAVLGTDLTAAVYGGGIEAAREAARDAMDQEVVADDIRETVVGREFRVRGTLSVDDYGANLEATEFEACDDDPADRAHELLDSADAVAADGAGERGRVDE